MSKAPKIVNSIPYGKKGLIPATCAAFEKTMLQRVEDSEIEEYARELIRTQEAVSDRRDEEKKNEKHQLDFDDVKRYLTLKIRDKEQKIKYYQNKLKETRQDREDMITKLQAEQDQLKQSHELELTQLTNTLKANKQKRDALATVAATEIQLKREIDEAEQTLLREKAQQRQQISAAVAESYMLNVKQQKQLKESVENEKAKNRGMTSENLERTVIEMMKEIDSEIKKYSNLVLEARDIADVNSKLMKLNKQKYMERDLLQQESDETIKKINRNDETIRKLVEELRKYDQRLAGDIENSRIAEDDDENPIIRDPQPIPEEEEEKHEEIPETPEEKPEVDRETLLNNFFENSVNVLCESVVEILGVYDPRHAEEYKSFHNVFNTFDGRKKELRFLMSKLGNLTFEPDDNHLFQPAGFSEVEGADEEITSKKFVEPQKRAIEEFAQPIADDELPDLIATHFFQ